MILEKLDYTAWKLIWREKRTAKIEVFLSLLEG